MIVRRYEFWSGYTWHCDVCRAICGGALVSVRKAADEHVCPQRATHVMGIDKNPPIDNDRNRAPAQTNGENHGIDQ